MGHGRGTRTFCGAAMLALFGCDDSAPVARRNATGGADSGTEQDARAGTRGDGGSPASGGTNAGGGGADAGGAVSGGASSSGGAMGTGGAQGPPIRGSTATPCLDHSDCASGMCIANFCDAPGCGPTPGITEVCDGKDNDCDAIADDVN